VGKLSDSQIREWMAAGVPIAGKADGYGLTFTLSAKGTAAWTLRYRIAGKQKELTLGRYPELSLEDARQRALAERQRITGRTDVAAVKATSRKIEGLRCEIGRLERELQRYEIEIEVIRARLEAARLELRLKTERGELWAS
jgi:Arm DNA-binding domain